MSLIERKWIADGAINGDKLDSGSSFTMADLTVTGQISGDLVLGSDATIQGNLKVDGTAYVPVIHSEVEVFDQLFVNQDDDQEALIIKQTNLASTHPVVTIDNTGSGYALTIDKGRVGFGTKSPSTDFELIGRAKVTDLSVTDDATVSGNVNANSFGGDTSALFHVGDFTMMRIEEDGASAGNPSIGISNSAPQTLAASGNRDLVVGNLLTDHGITVVTGSASIGTLAFSDGSTLTAERGAGRIRYDHNYDRMYFHTQYSLVPLTIDATCVGANNQNPIGSGDPSWNQLVVGSGIGTQGMTVLSGETSYGGVMFGTSTDKTEGGVLYDHSANRLILRNKNYDNVWITSLGHLVASTTDSPHSINSIINADYSSSSAPVISAFNRSLLADTPVIRASVLGSADTSAALYEGLWGSTRVFKVDATGNVIANTFVNSYPADFAEWCEVEGNLNDYPVGTVVQQSDTDLVVTRATNKQSIYGVVTDRATFCGGLTRPSDNAKQIAMVGHVKARVKGPVKAGQKLTLSDVPGVGKAADSYDDRVFAFGIARETSLDEEGVIEVRLL